MQKKGFRVGFVGVPPLNLINNIKKEHKDIIWFDLDEPVFNRNKASLGIPKTTCKIIQTIYLNFVETTLDLLIVTIGKSKCNYMEYLIPIFKSLRPNLEIIQTENNDNKIHEQTVCESNINLIDKLKLICKSVVEDIDKSNLNKTKAKAAFWGVPPYDYSILELFPKGTKVYGWTRCMEAKVPGNLELELKVDENIPTVFYSQLFCAKSILAKYLAKKHNGLFVESDGIIDNSIKEKISAFLELNNCY